MLRVGQMPAAMIILPSSVLLLDIMSAKIIVQTAFDPNLFLVAPSTNSQMLRHMYTAGPMSFLLPTVAQVPSDT